MHACQLCGDLAIFSHARHLRDDRGTACVPYLWQVGASRKLEHSKSFEARVMRRILVVSALSGAGLAGVSLLENGGRIFWWRAYIVVQGDLVKDGE